MLSRILAVTGLTGTIVALAFAAPAGAANVDRMKGACLTQGTVKNNPPVQFVGGTGGYTYSSLFFQCVTVEISKGTAVSLGLVSLDVTSPGKYTNIICGTGKPVSDPNSITVNAVTVTPLVGTFKTTTLAQWSAIANDMDYTVEFVVFNGLLKWTDNDAQKVSPDVPKVLVAGPGGFPGGYILLILDQLKGVTLPNACTKAFQVAAVLIADWSQSNPIV